MAKTRIVSQDIGDGTVLPADLDVSADNTTADATTGHHGLLLKLGGGSTNFLRADGTWNTPSGTGAVASDTIWDAAGDLAVGSGADTAAKLTKGADGGMLAMGNGSVIWNAGSSFPGSKATNDRYWRTDLGMGFYWDGTRWVSEELFRTQYVIATAISVTSGAIAFAAPPLAGGSDIWLVNWTDEVFITGGTALSASHKWVGTLSYRTVANANTVIATSTVDSGTLSNWLEYSTNIAALQDSGSAKKAYVMTWTKTGTPGTLQAASTLSYRIVAT